MRNTLLVCQLVLQGLVAVALLNQVASRPIPLQSAPNTVEELEVAAGKRPGLEVLDGVTLDATEVQMVKELWAFRSLVDSKTRTSPRPPLVVDQKLVDKARIYAHWMAANKRFQHSRSIMEGFIGGENIARGAIGAKEVTKDWSESLGDGRLGSGHRGTMLGPWTKVGVAAARDENNVWYWIQMFDR